MVLGALNFVQASEYLEQIVSPAYNKENISTSQVPQKQPYLRGEAIVVMKDGVSEFEASSAMAQMDMKVAKKFNTLSSKSKNRFMLIRSELTTLDLMEKLQKNPNVKFVSPNYRREMTAEPNDPKFTKIWALNNTGQEVNGTSGTDDADIDAVEAWDTESNASDMIVAVFDTGIFYQHEDLVDNMWINSSEVAGDGMDNDGNGYIDDIYGYDFAAELDGSNDSDPSDINGHGTHVAGIIGAKGNNALGISGVNWDVKIMAIKVFRPNLGAFDSDILEAIDYVLTMKASGANIVSINASYGSASGSQSDPMNNAIRSLGDAGIVFVAAAGNGDRFGNGVNNDDAGHYPASYNANNIISVAATNQDDNITSFSNYGQMSVDLGAPGNNILSTFPGEIEIISGVFDDVESGDGNWTHTGDGDTWAITEEESKSPTHAWSDSPEGNYTTNTNSSLAYATDINLTAYTGQDIGAGACLKYDIEDGWDFLYIEASGDSGITWKTLKTITGTQNDWVCGAVVIPEVLKTENFKMRYRLKTDRTVNADGVYIDDMVIGTISMPSEYTYKNGTSMAAPYVSGSIALIVKQFSNDNVHYLVNRVLSGVDELGILSEKVSSKGRLNIVNSIDSSLVLKPMILDINQTEGLILDTKISVNGIEFGDSQGKIYFSNGKGNQVEGNVTSWSESSVSVSIPKDAGKFISLESADLEESLNTVQGSAWKHIVPLGGERTFAAAVAYNDKIYVFGGVGPDDANSTEVYDPKTEMWTIMEPMPTPRYFISAAKFNDKIYVIGGFDSTTREIKDIVEVYDPSTNTWLEENTTAPLPKALFAGKAVVIDGSLYYVAGAELAPRRVILDTLYMYNESNNTWSEKANLNLPRITHEVVAYNGQIYVFGGHQGGGVVHSLTETYNPVDNNWTVVAEMPTTLWFLSATATLNGITIAGGDRSHHDDSSQVMHYYPISNTWHNENGSLKELISPRVASSLVHLPNRGLYIIGGGRHHRLDSVGFLSMNNLPIVENDTASVDEDTSISINVLENDNDGDGGSAISLDSVTAPENGTVEMNGTSVIYTPNPDYSGTDSFTYTVRDIGGATATAMVSVTVTAVNDIPVAENDTASTDEDIAVSLSVLSNDSDVDGDTLIISSVTNPLNGTAVINGINIIYEPNTNYSGTDSFTYTVSDGNGGSATATVHITVHDTIDLPGGGCTYNPNNKSIDIMFILMLAMSLFYPLRSKYLKIEL